MNNRAPHVRDRRDGGGAPEEACLTCSDWAETYRVVELLDDGRGLVDTETGTEEVSVALVDARVGDLVLVHAGEALVVVEPG